MDLVKKETPIPTTVNADQVLIKETGGIHGRDNSGHVDATRKEIAGNLGVQSDEVIPISEAAEKGLKEVGQAGFLAAVGIEEEKQTAPTKVSDPSSGLTDFGKNVTDLLPKIGEQDNVEIASSRKFDEIVKKRGGAE